MFEKRSPTKWQSLRLHIVHRAGPLESLQTPITVPVKIFYAPQQRLWLARQIKFLSPSRPMMATWHCNLRLFSCYLCRSNLFFQSSSFPKKTLGKMTFEKDSRARQSSKTVEQDNRARQSSKTRRKLGYRPIASRSWYGGVMLIRGLQKYPTMSKDIHI